MKKRWKKIGLSLFILIVVGLICLIVFSPFGNKEGFKYKILIHTVDINAPVDSVFNFLGNSGNASRWSSYVDHIVPLNGDEISDGKVGSIRRCYKEASERGQTWDERIILVEKNKRRQLIIYNMQEFDMKADGLATEQLYEVISPLKTRLSFTLFYKDEDPSIMDLLKTYFAAFSVKKIFEKNLSNVKRIIETGK